MYIYIYIYHLLKVGIRVRIRINVKTVRKNNFLACCGNRGMEKGKRTQMVYATAEQVMARVWSIGEEVVFV